jgi:uncharacterized protein YjbI with pentapeptide repeats
MSPQVEAALIAGVVSLISLGGTVVVAVIGFRATRSVTGSTLAEQRIRTLNERFATAADQLGSDKPSAVPLAGVYAMAGLADDWEENRQTCVDVLCAYLRMPYEPDPGQDGPEPERISFRANREIRHTVIRVITAHLKQGAVVSWQGLNFDFTGAVFDGGDFSEAKFSGGTVSFNGAEFSGGEVSFHGAKFCGADVSFNNAKFSGGDVDFHMTEFSGGIVGFYSAEFSGAAVRFGGEFSGADVRFQGAKFSGGIVVFGSEFSGGIVVFSGADFSGGTVIFYGARFSGGTVTFSDSFTTRSIGPDGRERNITRVTISGAKFCGADVSFLNAWFSGGTVDFSDAGDWSVPPAFPWADTPPPGVLLFDEDQPPSMGTA